MFYPACPKCGGKVESAEATQIDNGNRVFGQRLAFEAMRGHSHPYLKAASTALTIGRAIYKRVPGGGAKRCTECGHEFR